MLYTKEVIDKMLEKYEEIPREQWHLIPKRSHIRFIKKGPEPLSKRFKPGGFITANYANKKPSGFIYLSTALPGSQKKVGELPPKSFPIGTNTTESIWKLIDTRFSLEISTLQKRLDALEASKA